jgi:hypothetical protein
MQPVIDGLTGRKVLSWPRNRRAPGPLGGDCLQCRDGLGAGWIRSLHFRIRKSRWVLDTVATLQP